jgi:hypothetical protein
MNLVDRQLPRETQIHIILDNLATHKTPRVRNWFARRPHYVLHFTPTGSLEPIQDELLVSTDGFGDFLHRL